LQTQLITETVEIATWDYQVTSIAVAVVSGTI